MKKDQRTHDRAHLVWRHRWANLEGASIVDRSSARAKFDRADARHDRFRGTNLCPAFNEAQWIKAYQSDPFSAFYELHTHPIN